MSNHIFFDWIPKDDDERRNGIRGRKLSEDIGDFVSIPSCISTTS